ncbi:hypothetical protein K435DRAFT_865935 [Dendrothele bispora CBS 962.96]|uniref:Uncharacterized protein n=1 Tax=Dendrothele bispora (strain CBS 962.96) TaxID=1314807 RepID=A0A4V4HDX2_DENBC|nr:hypothetical protein K435DRAFT_865935 [Dendrothele bispora CBS 962.96]
MPLSNGTDPEGRISSLKNALALTFPVWDTRYSNTKGLEFSCQICPGEHRWWASRRVKTHEATQKHQRCLRERQNQQRSIPQAPDIAPVLDSVLQGPLNVSENQASLLEELRQGLFEEGTPLTPFDFRTDYEDTQSSDDDETDSLPGSDSETCDGSSLFDSDDEDTGVESDEDNFGRNVGPRTERVSTDPSSDWYPWSSREVSAFRTSSRLIGKTRSRSNAYWTSSAIFHAPLSPVDKMRQFNGPCWHWEYPTCRLNARWTVLTALYKMHAVLKALGTTRCKSTF